METIRGSKEPICLYPYYSELLPFVRHFGKLQNKYKLVELFADSGSGLIGHDASFACNHPKVGINVNSERQIHSSTCSTLLMTGCSDKTPACSNHLQTLAKNELQSGKAIELYCDPRVNLISLLDWSMNRYSDKLQIHKEQNTYEKHSYQIKTYNTINCPIILVGSLIECSDSLEVILCLTEKLREIKINPAVITKQPLGKIFGFHTLNHLFYDTVGNQSEIIGAINRYFAFLKMENKPDVFIIEAPDAVMRFNDLAPNGFGIKTYMLAQAVSIDYFICCFPLSLMYEGLVRALSQDFSIRLGAQINAVQVSNIVIDNSEMFQTRRVDCAYVELEQVSKRLKNEITKPSIPIVNVITDQAEKLCQEVVSFLGLK